MDQPSADAERPELTDLQFLAGVLLYLVRGHVPVDLADADRIIARLRRIRGLSVPESR